MQRFLILCAAFLLCGMLAGCNSETPDYLIDETIRQIDQAATEVTNIQTAVNKAIKVHEENQKPLKSAGSSSD